MACTRTVLWHGTLETITVPDHAFSWSGRVPCTGTYRCVHCGAKEVPMKLLTKELLATLPKLGTHDGKDPKDVPIHVKFFDPSGSWTWYVTEGEEDDGDVVFFGLVRGCETELGDFSLSELESVRGRLGLGIERDLYFGRHTLAEAMERQI